MAFGGSGGVTLQVYRPQDVTAQAPHSLVFGEDVARSGEDIAGNATLLELRSPAPVAKEHLTIV